MKRAESHWLSAGVIGGLSALAIYVAKDGAQIGSWLALAFGCAFGFGWRGARQVDAEAETGKGDVKQFGRKGA